MDVLFVSLVIERILGPYFFMEIVVKAVFFFLVLIRRLLILCLYLQSLNEILDQEQLFIII